MRTAKEIRLMLVSKSPLAVKGIRALLGRYSWIQIVGEVLSPRQILRNFTSLKPDAVLMDTEIGGPDTLSLIRRMKQAHWKVNIVMFGVTARRESPAAYRQAGATQYLPRTAGAADLAQVLRSHRGIRRGPSSGFTKRPAAPFRTKAASWAILWIMACAHPAAAQEAGPFYLSSPFTATVVREEQLPLGKTRVDDFAAILALPGLTLGRILPTSEVSLTYSPEFEMFSKYKDLNAWNHAASFRFSQELSPRWTFAARDFFLLTHDPTRSLRDSIFLLPRSRFTENLFSLALDYRLSPRTTFAWGFDHTVSFLSIPDLPAGQSDQMAGALTGSVSRMLTPRQRLTASYSFISLRDLNAGETSSLVSPVLFQRAHSVNLGYGYASEGGMFLEASGGNLFSDGNAYTVSGRIGKSWPFFAVNGGYSRQVSIFRIRGGPPDPASSLSSGLLPGSIYHLATLNLAGTAGGRLGIELGASAGTNHSALPGGDLRSLTGRIRVTYRIGERFFPFVGADFYGQNFNELTQSSLARKRFMGGVAFYISSPSEWGPTHPGTLEAAWPAGIPGLVFRPRERSGNEGESSDAR